jgi:hypothetical protein
MGEVIEEVGERLKTSKKRVADQDEDPTGKRPRVEEEESEEQSELIEHFL